MNRGASELKRSWRKGVAALAFLLVLSCATRNCHAEAMPTAGTFRGIFHKNSAGVGEFGYFVVHKHLLEKLAAYDGKYIELEVLNARQWSNPGTSVIQEIGAIKELPSAPLQIQAEVVSTRTDVIGAFDIICHFKNVSTERITFKPEIVSLGISSYDTRERPDELDEWLGAGYTNRQLGFQVKERQTWDLLELGFGQKMYSFRYGMYLDPGASITFIRSGLKIAPGPYELRVSAVRYSYDGRSPAGYWKAFDIPLQSPRDESTPSPLQLESQATWQDDWLSVKARVFNTTNTACRIFAATSTPTSDREQSKLFPVANLRAFDANGKVVNLELKERNFYGEMKPREVNEHGMEFHCFLRPTDEFSSVPLKRIELWMATDTGLLKLMLVRNVPPAIPYELPRWGKVVSGCHCRIRAAKKKFSRSEPIRLFFQFESDGKDVDAFLDTSGKDNAEVVIGNGAVMNTFHIGFYFLAFQTEIPFPANLKLRPGKHKIQVELKGSGGVYKDLNNRIYRLFSGTLVSNAIEVEVI